MAQKETDSADNIQIFDTTLRDGMQATDVSLSIHDKLVLTERLDEFGIDYIEGGQPASNPRDEKFFQKAKKLNLKHAKLSAFGSTARHPDRVNDDAALQKLLAAETPAVTIFGKTWQFHSKQSLGLTDAENEELIYKSVLLLKEAGREVIFDAEHFFDGYKDNPAFAIKMLQAAEKAGADTLALCDTNGGLLPYEIGHIVKAVKKAVTTPLGIHAHNDSESAVANSIMALTAGVTQVQGTINGIGERCGNANLCSILPNMMFKMKNIDDSRMNMANISSLSHFLDELLNQSPYSRAPFVGKSAFAHKGGIHVSSILKDSRMYEHIQPAQVGNQRHVVVSDLSGQSNLRYMAQKQGIELPPGREFSKKFIKHIKDLEYEGFQFDGAEASFELLLMRELGEYTPFFEVTYSKVNDQSIGEEHYSEVVLKVKVESEIEHTAADGNGPVNALDNALRKALTRFYPQIEPVHLTDYKVRVLGEKDGTYAKVRVLVESTDGQTKWSTVGMSHDIIKASLGALCDSLNYKILKDQRNSSAPGTC